MKYTTNLHNFYNHRDTDTES